MPPAHYDTAIEALAVLIGRWLENHPDPCPDCADDLDSHGQLLAA